VQVVAMFMTEWTRASVENASDSKNGFLNARLVVREIPKIGGSSAAFIALIVILVVIILVSLTAAIYLIREERSGDEERTNRHLSARYQHPLPASPSPFAYKSPAESNSLQWTSYLNARNWFGRTNPAPQATATRNDRGWMPTSSGSEFETYSVDEFSPTRTLRSGNTTMREGSPLANPRSVVHGDVVSPHRIPSPLSLSDSVSSARFDLHETQNVSSSDRFVQLNYPNIHTHLVSPTSSSPSPSPGPIPDSRSDSPNYADGQGSLFATQSGLSIRTFEGGTKFIEAL